MDDAAFGALLTDLRAESEGLQAILAHRTDDDWYRSTPAAGWDVHDQIVHLAVVDELAGLALTDPAEFERQTGEILAVGSDWVDRISHDRHDLPVAELRQWFGSARVALLGTLAAAGPAARCPWFGPSMSAASSATARLMETWAHGQDVYDALGLDHPVSNSVVQVSHLGVLTRGFSYRLHGRPIPATPVRVELLAPGGELVGWGPGDAADRITGTAEDFALVVTQRRHRADTALRATAGPAQEWLDIAQAYAGNPGTGRPAGTPDRPGGDSTDVGGIGLR